MKVEQIYTGCLAQGAYYIESNGEVAIVDPLREVKPYIDLATKRSAKIKYIFETHFHADFVSGHVTLAEKTGAKIVYGPNAAPDFTSTIAHDLQEFKLGSIVIRVLHTPGHTMESTSYLLLDEENKEHALFTGDTLFLGDVGRPDLAQKASSTTKEELAGILFDSLRSKIMTLPDDTIVYPGHGAGSACGKNMSKETIGTIGHEKATNYALRSNMTRAEFIQEVTHGLEASPSYFPMNVKLNKQGYQDIDEVIESGQKALTCEEFEAAANETGAVVLDVRHQKEFLKSHIPNSTFIGLDGNFAPWVGALIQDVKHPILLIADPDRVEESIIRLARVGFDNVIGYLDGGMNTWKNEGRETETISSIQAGDFENLDRQKINVIDFRKSSEFQSEHLIQATNIPLSLLNEYLDKIPEDQQNYIHCAGGYRSVIAASILKSRGIHNLINIEGGFKSLKNKNIEISGFVCPSKL